jgi:cytochrome P450
MAFDMVIAGIDTTGNTFAFLVYQLSRHECYDHNATI